MSADFKGQLTEMIERETATRDVALYTTNEYHKAHAQQVEEGYHRIAKQTHAKMERQTARMWQADKNIKALEAAIKALATIEKQEEQGDVCPFDCDSCHSEDCPCDRLGCEGNPL